MATAQPSPAAASPARFELWAAIVAAAIAIPAAYLFAQAMADSEVRRRESPVRAMIGTGTFDKLSRGEKTPLHYYGAQLGAPDFALPDRNGELFTLSNARGKVVVMNFWTVTCQPCVEEMPSLVRLAGIAKNNPDLEVIAITSDKQWSDVETLFPPDSPLKVLFDPEKKVIAKHFGSRLFPETWIIDRNGVIRLRVDGPKDWASPLSLDVINSFL